MPLQSTNQHATNPTSAVQSPLDVEKQPETPVLEKLDIEHALVDDDPRNWTSGRKWAVLVIISAASMVAGLSANIQNPANQDIEQTLHASSSDISWSLSCFILVQGTFPLLWSAISEIKGRKIVYLLSFALFALGSTIVAVSHSIGLLIGMRIVQGAGSSAVMAIGAGTLADIFDPAERGTKFGLYYGAPLLGPSVGAILGGGLTQAFGWRAVFWFLVIFAGLNFLSFLFLFKDTFRRERSSTYQTVLKRRTLERALKSKNASQATVTDAVNGDRDADARTLPLATEAPPLKAIKLSLRDINPFPPLWLILRRKNNLAILFPSGLLFAFTYSITYTCARTLANQYGYDPLTTGLVLLSFGVGCIFGSVLGGRWSDAKFVQLKKANGGKSEPEMRLKSTIIAMWFLPPSVVGYAWVCEQHVHVAAVCVMLFLAGFFTLWIYASTLAYIVDANVGRSSTAAATNSAFRGIAAFVAAEVAIPLQNSIGDGGMYTLWAGLLAIAELLIILVLWRGSKWRDEAIEREMKEANEQ
ncbi:MFS general substrate transporter [Athelia psychrophila]|uniref:MFS general substrate transporter n=1 Tax=Athelia psychrophila TaxID=1759441 RepID=A0A167UMW0_9AGAM|nr:MFS general substrate transporter [Fibularhizoctonia sp. CBS 109695]